MSLVTIARAGRKKLFVERLEDRAVPDATLLSRPFDVRGNLLTTGVNDEVQVLGASDRGDTLLVQSAATNLSQNQNSPPLQTNLFLVDTRADPTSFSIITTRAGSTANSPRTSIGVGVVRSDPGVTANSLISGDGSTVVFLSNTPASILTGDNTIVDAGGDDVFTYDVNTQKITLVSKDATNNALGGLSQVSNPSISRDGKTVAFVSTADARDVTRNNAFWDQAYDYDERSFSPGNFVTFFDFFGRPFTLFGERYESTLKNTTPDLFRAVVGQTPQPVTYKAYSAKLNGVNGFAPDGQGLNTDARYLMDGDVTVDPLGRYMNADGNGFVVVRKPTTAIIDPLTNKQAIGLSQGLWRFAFNKNNAPATDTVDPVESTRALATAGANTTINGVFTDRTQITVTGAVSNAVIAKDAGYVLFPYQRDLINGKFAGDALNGQAVPNFTDHNGSNPDLYLFTSNTVDFTTRQLISAQNGTVGGGLFGTLDLRPGAYQITPDGSKVVWTAPPPNAGGAGKDRLSYTVDPTDLDAVKLVPVPELYDGSYHVYQRNTVEFDPVAAGANQQVRGYNLAVSIPTRTVNGGNAPAQFNPGSSFFPTQTEDGLSVAFVSESDLTAANKGAFGAAKSQIYLYERLEGKPARIGARPRMTTVSSAPGGVDVGSDRSFAPLITGGFRFNRQSKVYFASEATNLDADIPAGNLGLGPNKTVLPQLYRAVFPVYLTGSPRTIVIAADRGAVTFGTLDVKGNVTNPVSLQPFGSRYKGEVRVALADVNGDGVLDIIAGAGFGGAPRVAVIDGFTTRTIRDFFAFESSFRGGVYVAGADVNGDGFAEIIVGAGEGGAPRVQMFDGASDALIFDQFAYEPTARTGVRVAAADITGDSIPDIVAAAGIGGGPRVRVYDGAQAAVGRPGVYADFFAYEQTQRGGVYIAAGDYDGDGYADILTGGGPDGGPRVTVFNGFNIRDQNPNLPNTLLDFFAFDPDSRDGARPAFKNITGQKNADIVVGTGNGPPIVRTFNGTIRGGDQGPLQLQSVLASSDPLALFGAWVG